MFYFQCCGFTDDGSDVASGQSGHYHEENPGQYHEVNPGQYSEVNPGQYHEVNPGQYHEVNPGIIIKLFVG